MADKSDENAFIEGRPTANGWHEGKMADKSDENAFMSVNHFFLPSNLFVHVFVQGDRQVPSGQSVNFAFMSGFF